MPPARAAAAADPPSLNDAATLGPLDDDVYAGVIRPALPDHDLTRLRGCLNDATANRTTATVLAETQATPR